MKLRDMKVTREEREEKNTLKDSYPASMDASYPYGLEIRLDNEALEKLGLSSMPKVGKRVRLEACCMVTQSSMNEHTDGKKKKINRSLSLQICRMGVSADPQSAEDAVDDAIDAAD